MHWGLGFGNIRMYRCDYTQCHLWWHYSHVRSEWSLLEVRKNQTVWAKSSEFMTCLDYDPNMEDHLHLMQLHLAWHIWCEHTIGFTVCVSEVGLASNSVWAVMYRNIWDTDFSHQVFYYLSSVFFSRHYPVNSMSTHSLLCHCQTLFQGPCLATWIFIRKWCLECLDYCLY